MDIQIKKLLIGITVGLLSMSAISAFSAQKSVTRDVVNAHISINKWINNVKLNLPQLLCEHFFFSAATQRPLKDANITKQKCLRYMGQSLILCLKKYNNNLPEVINRESGSIWGEIIGGCTGTQFYNAYVAKVYTKKTFGIVLKNIGLSEELCSQKANRGDGKGIFSKKQCISSIEKNKKSCIKTVLKDQPEKFEGTIKVVGKIMSKYKSCLVASQ